jgi:hypothetical protein
VVRRQEFTPSSQNFILLQRKILRAKAEGEEEYKGSRANAGSSSSAGTHAE